MDRERIDNKRTKETNSNLEITHPHSSSALTPPASKLPLLRIPHQLIKEPNCLDMILYPNPFINRMYPNPSLTPFHRRESIYIPGQIPHETSIGISRHDRGSDCQSAGGGGRAREFGGVNRLNCGGEEGPGGRVGRRDRSGIKFAKIIVNISSFSCEGRQRT